MDYNTNVDNLNINSKKEPMQTIVPILNSAKVASIKRSTPSDIETVKEPVYAFTLQRSFISKQLVNVVAVDKKGELLATVQPDLTFDEGADMVELLNASLKGNE